MNYGTAVAADPQVSFERAITLFAKYLWFFYGRRAFDLASRTRFKPRLG